MPVQKHVRGQTLRQLDQSADAFHDGAKPKVKKQKPGAISYACDFNKPLGMCACGRGVGNIGYRRGGEIVCYACATKGGKP